MCQLILTKSWFYSYHNLQGSQTIRQSVNPHQLFYSYHNLQGSQTMMPAVQDVAEVLLLS